MHPTKRIAGLSLVLVACSGALTQQAIATLDAVAQCVAPTVLDVTGLATEDPAQIAQNCGVAVADVFAFVTAELASIQSNAPEAGTVATTGAPSGKIYQGTRGRFYNEAQYQRLLRIQAKASAQAGASSK